MPRRKQVIAGLERVIQLAELRKDRPSAQLLDQISGRVREAIELLRMPDSERKRIEFILLAIQESTEVRKHLRNGKTVTRVHVVDLELYNWGMEKLHALASPV